jgi:hypothetical protein
MISNEPPELAGGGLAPSVRLRGGVVSAAMDARLGVCSLEYAAPGHLACIHVRQSTDLQQCVSLSSLISCGLPVYDTRSACLLTWRMVL